MDYQAKDKEIREEVLPKVAKQWLKIYSKQECPILIKVNARLLSPRFSIYCLQIQDSIRIAERSNPNYLPLIEKILFFYYLIKYQSNMYLLIIIPPMNAHDEDYYMNQGLPNLGNTCYLNSAIQFLYSSDQLREIMSQKYKGSPASSMTNAISHIFHYITMSGSLSSKQMHIKRLIKIIQSIDKHIICHSQQDFFQILMLILNKLFQQNQGLQQLFVVQTENTCNCGTFYTTNLFLMSMKQKCITCEDFIEVKIRRQSPLLIVSSQKSSIPQGDLYRQYNGSSFLYQCIAKIFYIGFGSSRFGHHRSSRLCTDNLFIQFNDQNAYMELDNNPAYLLYQKVSYQKAEKKEGNQNKVNINLTYKSVNSSLLPLNNKQNISHLCRSELNFVSQVTEGDFFKSPRIIYFFFQKINALNQIYFQMNVVNEDDFIFQIPPICKKYQKNSKESEELFISSFLNEYEQKMNLKICRFYKQGKGQQQKSYLSKIKNIFKDLPQIEFIRRE